MGDGGEQLIAARHHRGSGGRGHARIVVSRRHLANFRVQGIYSPAADINPVTRGWINYYGVFYRSKLRFLAWRITEHIVRWAMKKYKRFRGHAARAFTWLVRAHQHQPALFAHWQLAPPLRGRPVGAG